MSSKSKFLLIAIVAIAFLVPTLTTCGQKDAKPTPEQALARQNDSIVVAEVLAVRENPSVGYAEVDLKILKSEDVEGIKNNPTKDKVGKVITVLTEDFVAAINIGEIVVCYVTLSSEGQQQHYVARSFLPGRLSEKE
jgi:predicted small lipoprotein YifL